MKNQPIVRSPVLLDVRPHVRPIRTCKLESITSSDLVSCHQSALRRPLHHLESGT